MNLDIHTAVQTTLLIILVLIAMSAWRGIILIRTARRLTFFRMRRNQMLGGWRLLFLAVFLTILTIILGNQVEPFVYRYFPPTATITITPTISLTPTITISPSITFTPLFSNTPTSTSTPYIPMVIESSFTSRITPNPDAAFSEIIFTQGIDKLYRPIAPGVEFINPVGHIYALYSYDRMEDGSQWTALWFRNGELVHYETEVWDGGTGGYGYTDWDPLPQEWLPGIYEVQIFNGLIWKRSGKFTVVGEVPTPAPTLTPTPSQTPTRTPTPTRTLWPTSTPQPSRTPRPTLTLSPIPSRTLTRTPYISPTITPTRTPYPTLTRTTQPPTKTLAPTRTPTLTRTRWPSLTPTFSRTPIPSWTITITPSITLTRTPYISPTITRTRTPYPTLTRTPVTPSITPQPTTTRTPTPTL